jgi:hypothetical protein
MLRSKKEYFFSILSEQGRQGRGLYLSGWIWYCNVNIEIRNEC